MFRRIVVGADGSPEGRDAIVLGRLIAEATGAGLTLLRAFPPFLLGSGETMTRRSQVHETERQLWAERRHHAPDAHAEIVAHTNPARALLSHAEQWHAELIVIGSKDDVPLGHSALGHTGRRLLDGAPTAIAIARRGLHREPGAEFREPGAELSTIAVGYDGDIASERALEFADALALAAGAELHIHTVHEAPIPVLLRGEPSSPALLQDLRDGARSGALEVARRAARTTTVEAEVEAEVGDPGQVLRGASEHADVMVIGSRRWGTIARLVLGGVGEALAADCGSSLIIVRNAPVDHDATTAL